MLNVVECLVRIQILRVKEDNRGQEGLLNSRLQDFYLVFVQ